MTENQRGFVEFLGPTIAVFLREESSICGATSTVASSCVAELWRRVI